MEGREECSSYGRKKRKISSYGRSVVATNRNVNDKDGRMEGSDGRKK
jgi:hypothetical protein